MKHETVTIKSEKDGAVRTGRVDRWPNDVNPSSTVKLISFAG